ncbi:MAG: hypothetical protein WAN36_11060 [Calditrichia bacterium]
MKKYVPILLLLLLACTNPFSVRDPDQPKINNQLQAANSLQNNPDSLLKKIQYAFSEENVNFYLDCIADSPQVSVPFTFIPQQDAANRLLPWQPWNPDDEYQYFFSLIGDPELEKLTLQIYNIRDWTLVNASQDSMQTRFDYEIQLKSKDGEKFFLGQSIFKIVRSGQSLWYVYFWEDLKIKSDQTEPTWSELKANYR